MDLRHLKSKRYIPSEFTYFYLYSLLVRFARDGSDKTKGRDIVVYLSNIMNKSENDIRNLLSRHPNWCHIPVLHVKQCYEFLKRKDFNNEEMYKNLHILIYPM